MVAFSALLAAFAAAIPSIAAPAPAPALPVERAVALSERGPHDFILGAENRLSRRSAINYNLNDTTGGAVDFSPSKTGFSVNWTNANDLIVGVGWEVGSNMPITHSGSFSVSSGTAFLCINGWTTNPLVEYYIIEDYANYPRQLTSAGNFTTDGSTYTIYEYTRVNQPAIWGISTYKQYFSA